MSADDIAATGGGVGAEKVQLAAPEEGRRIGQARVQLAAQAGRVSDEPLIPHDLMNVAEPECAGPEGWARIIEDAVHATRGLKKSIQDAAVTMSPRAKRRAVWRLLECETFRVAVLFDATQRRRAAIKQTGDGWTRERVVRVGRLLDPFQPAIGEVLVGKVEKSKGGSREVFSYPLVEYALHKLAAGAWRLVHQPHPRQFGPRFGDREFKRWLRENLPNAACVLRTDVPSCFYSLSHQRIMECSPLPRRVIEARLVEPFAGQKPGKFPREGNTEDRVVLNKLARPQTHPRGYAGWLPYSLWTEGYDNGKRYLGAGTAGLRHMAFLGSLR